MAEMQKFIACVRGPCAPLSSSRWCCIIIIFRRHKIAIRLTDHWPIHWMRLPIISHPPAARLWSFEMWIWCDYTDTPNNIRGKSSRAQFRFTSARPIIYLMKFIRSSPKLRRKWTAIAMSERVCVQLQAERIANEWMNEWWIAVSKSYGAPCTTGHCRAFSAQTLDIVIIQNDIIN